MEIVLIIIQSITAFLGCLTALLSILLFLQLQWPAPGLWLLKLFTAALSPLFVLIGVLTTIAGMATGSLFTSVIGIYNVLIFGMHIYSVTRPPGAHCNFEKAFGLHWEDKIHPGLKNTFLQRRTVFNLPGAPGTRMEQDIPFTTIPGTGRELLCDIWQPPENVAPSGLAFIYLHGSAWYFLDKDLGTRPFF